jgi:hypothetical protein
MKLITRNAALERELLRCLKHYSNIALATAWASADTSMFRLLCQRRQAIRRAVIGTHFYQTHPDVVDKFIEDDDVRFMLQTSGTFHPKVFVFWDASHWEAMVGSANFTKGAISSNAEAALLISQSDAGCASLNDELVALINGYWKQAKTMSAISANAYREQWKRWQPNLSHLSGQYGKSASPKPPVSSRTMSMSWRAFFNTARKDKEHDFDERCDLLERARKAFQAGQSLNTMEPGLRYTIAGLPTDFDHRWAAFGSMRGAGKYFTAIKANDIHLSKAVDLIPLEGFVTRQDYDAYLREYMRAFPEGRHGISTATRLLALMRPDQFVCFDSRNRAGLCADFGIKVSGMDYERYWDEVVERIMDTPWWNSPPPATHGVELSAWKGRAAMLDAIFYVP